MLSYFVTLLLHIVLALFNDFHLCSQTLNFGILIKNNLLDFFELRVKSIFLGVELVDLGLDLAEAFGLRDQVLKRLNLLDHLVLLTCCLE